jgi:hypothetical protein
MLELFVKIQVSYEVRLIDSYKYESKIRRRNILFFIIFYIFINMKLSKLSIQVRIL